MTNRASLVRSLTLLAFISLLELTASAAPVQFTIDSAQSQVTATGSVIGFSLQEQGPGSLTTTFQGTLVAVLDGTSIQFTEAGTLTARTNGVWRPGPGGKSGNAPADFAAKATTPLGSVEGALRNITLTVTSGLLGVTNGQFNAGELIFQFPENSPSTFDYDAGFLLGSDGLSLQGFATNQIVSLATITGAPGAQTLTIELDTEFKFAAITPNDSAVRLKGRLVANESTALTIASITINGQNVILRVRGAGEGLRLESSAKLPQWTAETPVRSEEEGETTLTLPVSGDERFYRVANE